MSIYSYDGKLPELPMNDDYWIAPNAQVMGSVRISSKCSIWFGAVLRGDNELICIGNGTNIQENTPKRAAMRIAYAPNAELLHALRRR